MRAEAVPTTESVVDLDVERAVERFLYREARLLDDGDFQAWLDLFTDDAVYWVPRERGQQDPLSTASIIYENKAVLSMRMGRLMHPRAYALDPQPHTTHLVGNIEVAAAEHAGMLMARAALVMVEYRDGSKRVFSGRCEYRLRRTSNDFRIASKRVDLVDCDGPLGPITVPF